MYDTYKNWVKKVITYFRRMALPKRIERGQIEKLPAKLYCGEIIMLEDVDRAKSAIADLMGEKILGFDTESKPAFTKGEFYPPSLVQLATPSKVYLFRLTGGIDFALLKPILENGNIWKVGVAVQHDIQKLLKIDNFSPRAFYDLGEFSKRLGIIHTGLRNLAAIFLHVRISKLSQLTDWSREQLTPRQIRYAATDAWISLEIFLKMTRYFN
jgi:ribonuclease D